MNPLRAILAACCLSSAIAGLSLAPGCKTAPTERVAAVQTLKGIGAARDAAMATAAGLLRDGRITKAQWDHIALLHDAKFLPAYRLAIAAAKADLSSVASTDLQALFQELFTAISALAAPTI